MRESGGVKANAAQAGAGRPGQSKAAGTLILTPSPNGGEGTVRWISGSLGRQISVEEGVQNAFHFPNALTLSQNRLRCATARQAGSNQVKIIQSGPRGARFFKTGSGCVHASKCLLRSRTGSHPSRSERDYGATGRDPAHQLWAKSESNHFSGFQCSANGSIPGVSNDFQSIPITFEKIMKPKDYLTRQGKIGCRPRARMNNEARMSNGGLRLVYPAKSAEIRP
jgi:hypothetical protein